MNSDTGTDFEKYHTFLLLQGVPKKLPNFKFKYL